MSFWWSQRTGTQTTNTSVGGLVVLGAIVAAFLITVVVVDCMGPRQAREQGDSERERHTP